MQTWSNLGVVDTRDDAVVVTLLHRSSVDSAKRAQVDRLHAHLALGGFEPRSIGGYPGSKPDPGSRLVELAQESYRETSGGTMEIVAVHAGLECGIIGDKYPAMQMISIGPDMQDVHTPDEAVSISSVARFWTLLRALLART